MQNCHFVLCTKNFALPVSTAVYTILHQAVNAGSAVYKMLYQAVETGSAVYKILYAAILYTALYNMSRCRVQSRYWRDSHPDQGCTKRVQPGNTIQYLSTTDYYYKST